MGTLSKAVGVFGGYIAASASLLIYKKLWQWFYFYYSLPPAICAAANKSIQFIQQNDQVRNFF
jgi:5-aminolevulinate synthase